MTGDNPPSDLLSMFRQVLRHIYGLEQSHFHVLLWTSSEDIH